ncbi:hypothetical protein NDU88_007372 [Pleurodeles waltl]|uniref:Uncharacterized protein n=1 Tax=Pleurodeles waltl TaxID=8319 RepID=A0AAV7TZW4_PLEWA|nr:hypothetical protein NDU88_007372 [Pleurodeles waltl]
MCGLPPRQAHLHRAQGFLKVACRCVIQASPHGATDSRTQAHGRHWELCTSPGTRRLVAARPLFYRQSKEAPQRGRKKNLFRVSIPC